MYRTRDIHPRTAVASLSHDIAISDLEREFPIELVSALVGMQPTFVRHVLGKSGMAAVPLSGVLDLLNQDAFHETFVPRSMIPAYLLSVTPTGAEPLLLETDHELIHGSALDLLPRLTPESVQCVVTSTPYWGTRLYNEFRDVQWADGEVCPLGQEQTPEGFIRHSIEILFLLKACVSADGSVWWNLMDSYNTRTQIRANASETLRAMNGTDSRGWTDYECRRYSAGHSFLKDGEQCQIPARVAQRASLIGYWLKSVVTWKKEGSMPETVQTRVTREAEYIIHLSRQRSPYFDKAAFRVLPKSLGGRNDECEAGKLTDVWVLPTAPGTDGHGAQFPVALPGRCIALSTRPGDLVLDPFVGSGTTTLAAMRLDRRSIGFDVSEEYLATARGRVKNGQSLLL